MFVWKQNRFIVFNSVFGEKKITIKEKIKSTGKIIRIVAKGGIVSQKRIVRVKFKIRISQLIHIKNYLFPKVRITYQMRLF